MQDCLNETHSLIILFSGGIVPLNIGSHTPLLKRNSFKDVSILEDIHRNSPHSTIKPLTKHIYDSQLGPYLAGLIEGDGTIYVPQWLRDDKGRIRYCFINVTFDIRDRSFALYLQSRLGGSIQEHPTYCIWFISAFNELVFITNLINGYMRTPKIEALNRLINFLHLHYPSLPVDEFKSLDTTPIELNAWLAGMWDADGGFVINISEASDFAVGHRVRIKAKIELRTHYHRAIDASIGSTSYYYIMQIIANFFNVNIRESKRFKHGRLYSTYVVEAGGMSSHKIVVSYFSSFPLFSSKYINYLRWLEVHQMQLKKEHATLTGLQHCIEIKNDFNTGGKAALTASGRAYLSLQSISWSHLSKFYI